MGDDMDKAPYETPSDPPPLPASVFLSIGEVDGNTTAISHYTGNGAGPRATLHEKVYCVLRLPNLGASWGSPIHTQSFSPRHLSALTLHLRTYDQWTNTYVDYTGPNVGLWFKLITDDC
jgi:hypothetical protein